LGEIRKVVPTPETVYAAFSPDGRRLLTVRNDFESSIFEVRVWDVDARRPLGPPLKHSQRVWLAAFGPGGERVLVVAHDPPGAAAYSADDRGRALLWEAIAGNPLTPAGPPLLHEWYVCRTALSLDGRLLAVACDPDAGGWSGHTFVQVWDTRTGKVVLPSQQFKERVSRVELDPAGRNLAIAVGRELRVVDLETGLSRFTASDGAEVVHTAFRPDGKRLLTVARLADEQPDSKRHRYEVKQWDMDGQPAGAVLTQEDGQGASASYRPDGARILVAGPGGVHLFEAESGMAIETALAGKPVRNRAVFAGAERVLAFRNDDHRRLFQARLWDVRMGVPVAPPLAHARLFRERMTLADSAMLVAEGGENKLQNLQIDRAVASPDGRWVATLTDDWPARRHEVRLWDAATGQPLAAPLRHHFPIVAARFIPDGRLMLVTNDLAFRTFQAWSWEIAPDTRPVADWREMGRLLGCGELDAAGFDQGVVAAGQEDAWHVLHSRHPDLFAPRPPIRPWWEEDPAIAHGLARRGLDDPGTVTDVARWLELSERAVRAEPGNVAYLGTLGAALLHAGRKREAVERLEEANRRHPQKGEAWSLTYLALARYRLGQSDEAEALLDRARVLLNEPGSVGNDALLWHRVRVICKQK
jgi:WD40 repeat protein